MTARQKLRRNRGKLLAQVKQTLRAWCSTNKRIMLGMRSPLLNMGWEVIACGEERPSGGFVFRSESEMLSMIRPADYELATLEGLEGDALCLVKLGAKEVHGELTLEPMDEDYLGPRLLSRSKPNGKGPHSGQGR